MKIGIKTKILIMMMIVGFIPGIIGVMSTYMKGSAVFRSAVGMQFQEITQQVALNLNTLVEKEHSEIELMATYPSIRHFISSGKDSEAAKEAIRRYLHHEAGKTGHLSVSLFTKEGIPVVTVGDFTSPPISKELIRFADSSPDASLVGAVLPNPGRGGFVLPIYKSIFEENSRTAAGFVGINLVVGKLFDQMESLLVGESGHVNIVSSEGTVFYDSIVEGDIDPFPKRVMKRVLKERGDWFVDIDEHGLESLIAAAPLHFHSSRSEPHPGEHLYLIMTQPVEEAFDLPIREVLLGAAIPGFFFASLLIILIYFTLSKIVNPIAILKKGATEIGQGNLDHRIDVETGDEIEALAKEFNEMAGELKGLYEGLEEKVAERTHELEMSNRELEKANRLKSEFLANMSHELRTPLNSIIGFSEVLIDNIYGETNEKQTKYLSNIHKSGNHLLELINDILDLSKIEAGKMEFILSEFLLSDAINEVFTIVNPLAGKKGVELTTSIEEGLNVMMADRLKFKQILYNLIGNAVKFTPEGGSVKVEVVKKSNHIVVSVIDTGIGIEEKSLDIIFDSFRQADGSYSRSFEGTGLGLSLTRKFVEMHGGRIWVESEPGRGSTFSFKIPIVAKPDQASSMASLSEVKPPHYPVSQKSVTEDDKKRLVLVIEDNENSSELLAMYLSEGGYDVAQAYNGEDGLQMAKDLTPFAITLDVMLPKKDGWQVLKDLKADDETREIPVVIISMVENEGIGYVLGALDTFTKPISKQDLLSTLKEHGFYGRKENVSILAVDDEPKILEYLAAVLEPEGFSVVAADSGRKAIDLAHQQVPDLIILDLLMPEMNGFEVVNALRADEKTKDVPIIVYTAKEMSSEEIERLKGSVNKIVAKGALNKEKLLKEIEKIG